jgi:site-specific DNA-methyltransferase (adenine-specific)
MEPLVEHLVGDCRDVLAGVPSGSVNLIVTSPPYANARKSSYGGMQPDNYAAWLLERTPEFRRVLTPDGTFVLNIKERVVTGERHTYVLEIIKGMRDADWLWTEEWIWHKTACHPGKWPNRFRDAWERLLQFNLQRRFAMYQDAVRVPIGEWARPRLANLSDKDRTRRPSVTGSGFGKNVSNWLDPATGQPKGLVYPSNVLHLSSETGNRGHPAAFPVALPEFFIKLFTQPDDTVLDPFAGSGTTGVAAVRLGRSYIGVDTEHLYIELAERRIRKAMSRR